MRRAPHSAPQRLARATLAVAISGAGLFLATSVALPQVASATTGVFGLGSIAAESGFANLSGDDAGNVWVADTENRQVDEVSASGTVLERWGTYGPDPQDLEGPASVVELDSGDVVIYDGGTDEIKEFTASGTYVGAFGGGLMSGAMTVGDDGDIYAETWTGIGQFDQEGNLLASWTYASLGISGVTNNGWEPVIAEQEGVISFLDGYGNLDQLTTSGTFIGRTPTSLATITADGLGGFYGRDTTLNGDDVLHLSAAGAVTSFAPGQYAEILGVTFSGGYVFALRGGASGSSLIRLDLSVPVAAITKSGGTAASQTATFNASGSYLPFGSITDYRWDLDGSGRFATDTGTTPTVSETLPPASGGSVSVLVTGSSGQTATATMTFSITPSQTVIATPGTQLSGSPVTISATGYGTVGGTATDYQWDFDGSATYGTDTGTSSSVTHTFTATGPATVDVRVTRPGGDVDTASVTFAVDAAPPPGPVGVTIDDGAYATDSTSVTISPVWPAFSTGMLISNDGGFGTAGNTTQENLASSTPWTIQTAGGGKVTRIVYVRFLGQGSTTTYSDDIVLDESTPTVADATITAGPPAAVAPTTPHLARGALAVRKRAKTHTWKVLIAAKEHISGVSAIEFSTRTSGGTVITLRRPTIRGVLNLRATEKYVGTTQPRYVRVRSAAGKWSKWVSITG